MSNGKDSVKDHTTPHVHPSRSFDKSETQWHHVGGSVYSNAGNKPVKKEAQPGSAAARMKKK